MLKGIFVFAGCLLLLAGCATTEQNKDNLVKHGREYVFDEIPHMSVQNVTFIKYTYPKILVSEINPSLNTEIGDPLKYTQICLVWELSKPDISLMVAGIGTKNFAYWDPVKIIFQKKQELKLKEIKNPDKYLSKEKTKNNTRAFSQSHRDV